MLRMDDYMGGLDEPFVLFFDGDTLPHKEDIKALGYKWRIAGEYACRVYTFERAKAIGAAVDSEIFARLEDWPYRSHTSRPALPVGTPERRYKS